jgi:anaerobic ribonucleoside-triphosphate reductase
MYTSNSPQTALRGVLVARVVGYIRPISQWNIGKQAEWSDRKMFKIKNI